MSIKQIKIGTKDFVGLYINGAKRDFFIGVSKAPSGGDTPDVPVTEDTLLVYDAATDTFTIKAGEYASDMGPYVLENDIVLTNEGNGNYTDESMRIYFMPTPPLDAYTCARADLINWKNMFTGMFATSSHSPIYMTCYDQNNTRKYLDSSNVYSSSGAYVDLTSFYNQICTAQTTSSSGTISSNSLPQPYWVDSTSTSTHGPLTKSFAAGEYIMIKYPLNANYNYDDNCLYTLEFLADTSEGATNNLRYVYRDTGEMQDIRFVGGVDGYPTLKVTGKELRNIEYVELVYTRTSSKSGMYLREGLYQVYVQPATGIYANASYVSFMDFGEEVYVNATVTVVSNDYDPAEDPMAQYQQFTGFLNYNFDTNKPESVTSTRQYDTLQEWCEVVP